MEYHLLIDDLKTLGVENIARTAKAGLKMLRENPVTHVYLDHDLGDVGAPTGYDVLTRALLEGILPEYVQLVTHNPVGRQNMERALENEGYVKSGNYWKRVK